MPNIEGLGLQNFRTFTKKENLEFAPITIITGTNNAGKALFSKQYNSWFIILKMELFQKP